MALSLASEQSAPEPPRHIAVLKLPPGTPPAASTYRRQPPPQNLFADSPSHFLSPPLLPWFQELAAKGAKGKRRTPIVTSSGGAAKSLTKNMNRKHAAWTTHATHHRISPFVFGELAAFQTAKYAVAYVVVGVWCVSTTPCYGRFLVQATYTRFWPQPTSALTRCFPRPWTRSGNSMKDRKLPSGRNYSIFPPPCARGVDKNAYALPRNICWRSARSTAS